MGSRGEHVWTQTTENMTGKEKLKCYIQMPVPSTSTGAPFSREKPGAIEHRGLSGGKSPGRKEELLAGLAVLPFP